MIGGVAMPAGTFITIGIGAANRDPAEFADPDRLDVGARAQPPPRLRLGRACLRRPQRGAAGGADRDRALPGAVSRATRSPASRCAAGGRGFAGFCRFRLRCNAAAGVGTAAGRWRSSRMRLARSPPHHAEGVSSTRRGEGSGVGVSSREASIVLRITRCTRPLFHPTVRPRLHPTPNPSPSRGGGTVEQASRIGFRRCCSPPRRMISSTCAVVMEAMMLRAIKRTLLWAGAALAAVALLFGAPDRLAGSALCVLARHWEDRRRLGPSDSVRWRRTVSA